MSWLRYGGRGLVGGAVRKCAVYAQETSAMVGTIFHGSRLPLRGWFAVVWRVVNRNSG